MAQAPAALANIEVSKLVKGKLRTQNTTKCRATQGFANIEILTREGNGMDEQIRNIDRVLEGKAPMRQSRDAGDYTDQNRFRGQNQIRLKKLD